MIEDLVVEDIGSAFTSFCGSLEAPDGWVSGLLRSDGLYQGDEGMFWRKLRNVDDGCRD